MTETTKKPAPKKQAKPKSDKPVVRVYHKGKNDLPVKESTGAAAVDLYAEIGQPELILNGQQRLVPTGLHVEVPEGYCFKIYARSGMAHKEGITPSNCVGIIDSDYRGQVFVSLANHGNTARWIQPDQRIAQMMLEKVIDFEWDEVETLEELSSTERGKGGFGSSGKGADGSTGKAKDS